MVRRGVTIGLVAGLALAGVGALLGATARHEAEALSRPAVAPGAGAAVRGARLSRAATSGG
jgi:hypothetical protein